MHYHQLSGLNNTNVSSCHSGGQRPTGVSPAESQGLGRAGSLPEATDVSWPLAPSSCLMDSSHLSDFGFYLLPPSFKDAFYFPEPTQIIQVNLPILKSLTEWHVQRPFPGFRKGPVFVFWGLGLFCFALWAIVLPATWLLPPQHRCTSLLIRVPTHCGCTEESGNMQ